MEPRRPDKLNRWQRWRIVFYGFVIIVACCFLGWGYLNYCEYREWALFDELLAEQDRKHPNWRWNEYQPKPLQPGQVNGALRFIEVGKQITEEMLTGSDVPAEDDLSFPYPTREYWTTLERESGRNSCRKVYQLCQHLEVHLPKLIPIQQGFLNLNRSRPSINSILGGGSKDEPVLMPDGIYLGYTVRWLRNNIHYHTNENNGVKAIQSWQAWFSGQRNRLPGKYYVGWSEQFYMIKDLCKILSRTEADEATLSELQKIFPLWRSTLFTLDDIAMDRAICVQHILENKSNPVWKENFLERYSRPPEWLPDSIGKFVQSWKIGTPSIAHIFRLEIATQLRILEALEERLKQTQSISELFAPNYEFVEQELSKINSRSGERHHWGAMIRALRFIEHDILTVEALVAAERYRLKYGKFPEQWNDLVPTWLESIPQIDNRPLILKQTSEGLVVYKIGRNGIDLGGKVKRVYDPASDTVIDSEIDDGFMLFHPKYRRQPPPPVKPKAKSEDL